MNFRIFCVSAHLFVLALAFAAHSPSVHGSMLMETISPFTGDSAQVKLTLDDAVQAGKVQIKVDVIPNPNIGDIQGVWLDILNDSLLSGLSVVSGLDVTQAVFGPAGTVNNLGGGNNLNGGGTPAPFDMGFQIGTPGIGSDDIQTTTFFLMHASVALDVNQFVNQDVGVRLTSVGLPGSSRNGSSKLGGTFDDPPTGGGNQGNTTMPEPTTLIVSSLLGLCYAAIRLRGRI
jgi:hypothetical protein